MTFTEHSRLAAGPFPETDTSIYTTERYLAALARLVDTVEYSRSIATSGRDTSVRIETEERTRTVGPQKSIYLTLSSEDTNRECTFHITGHRHQGQPSTWDLTHLGGPSGRADILCGATKDEGLPPPVHVLTQLIARSAHWNDTHAYAVADGNRPTMDVLWARLHAFMNATHIPIPTIYYYHHKTTLFGVAADIRASGQVPTPPIGTSYPTNTHAATSSNIQIGGMLYRRYMANDTSAQPSIFEGSPTNPVPLTPDYAAYFARSLGTIVGDLRAAR